MWRSLAFLGLCACTTSSGFAGDYEAVAFAHQQGGCGGELIDEPVSPDDQWFRLDDVDAKGGLLVGYYACTGLDQCDDLYDLARSFGRAKDDPHGWAGYLSTAIPATPCMLSYRVRRLVTIDRGVEIDEQVFRMADGSLSGSACNDSVASERGTSMPCVEDRHLAAEER